MSFSLVTAINVEDIPVILRRAANNYRSNAQHDLDVMLERTHLKRHYPELWQFAAQMLEEVAEMLQSQIDAQKTREAPLSTAATKTKRVVL